MLFMLSSVLAYATQESMKIENKKFDLAAFSNLLVVKWGMSDSCLFSQKLRISSFSFSGTVNLNVSKERAAPH